MTFAEIRKTALFIIQAIAITLIIWVYLTLMFMIDQDLKKNPLKYFKSDTTQVRKR